jgi:integrase
LDRLSPVRVEGFYSLMVDRGLAPSSVLLAHQVLSGALQAAVRRGLVVVNVCRLVDTPRRTVGEVEPLTLEVRRVLEVAEDRRGKVRWTLALGLGLRQGVALGLLWRHVDLEGGRCGWRGSCSSCGGGMAATTRPAARWIIGRWRGRRSVPSGTAAVITCCRRSWPGRGLSVPESRSCRLSCEFAAGVAGPR